MATQDTFSENLGRIYGVYAGGFIGFVMLMAGLEYAGVPFRYLLWGFLALTFGVYAVLGIVARTALVSEYYVAGRKVPAVYNGMATGADWISGAGFVGMAGTLFVLGYDGLAFVLGWTGGYVLVAVLLAPYLRKVGAYTVPDFLGTRFGGNLPRLLAILVLFCCSFIYLTAQIYATGIIASQFLGIGFDLAVFAGLVGILACSMLGGMRAVTWTQVAQYIVLIIAFLVPAIWMSTVETGVPIPPLSYGAVLGDIAEMEQTLGVARAHAEPFTEYSPRDFFFLIFCLMVGTAAMPHVLMRFFTTPTVREARKSVGWSLLFIFLLYFTAPAYAAFAKSELMTLFVEAPGLTLSFQAIPDWMLRWGSIQGHNLVTICGAPLQDSIGATGAVLQSAVERVREACAAQGMSEGFSYDQLRLDRDMIVLATPEIAGMPWFVVGLVGAGALAATLSTADGLVLAIANALSHDGYYRMIDPQADSRRRLLVARLLVLMVAVGAALMAQTRPSDLLTMVAWAFSIAGAGLFAPLVLGIWDARANQAGAIAGILAGFGVTVVYLIGNVYGLDLTRGTGDEISWYGVASISAGIFGIPAAFVAMFVVSRLTPEPSPEMQDMVRRLRLPRGPQVIDQTS